MKRMLRLWIISLFSLCLASCSVFYSPYSSRDLTNENWAGWVHNNPNAWVRGADRWFLTGDPNRAEATANRAPYEAAISTMTVNVPDFKKMVINSEYEVQIFGACDHNSVYVYGPNNQVRNVVVDVRGDTLFLGQLKAGKASMRHVVVRVGVVNLTTLVQLGCGVIEGRQVRSNRLFLKSLGGGNIYLSGDVNLQQVDSRGNGSISVFGARTPWLAINTCGRGAVNISGNLGLQAIKHHGSGDINLIGVTPNHAANIYADGSGKIGINGDLYLNQLVAKGSVRIYLLHVFSRHLGIYVQGSSIVGMRGYTGGLNLNVCGSACFQGRYLCSEEAYIRATGGSHINVAAKYRAFASAEDVSSIYFFGSQSVLTRFASNSASILAIWGDPGGCSICVNRPQAQACRGGEG